MGLFGIEFPIVQAPMAGSQGHALAAAVSNAGGLGSLPCAVLGLDAVRQELTALKAQTNHPFNVNFFCHAEPALDPSRERAWREALAPYYAELGVGTELFPSGPARSPFSRQAAHLLAELSPPVVSFHFGLPAEDLLEPLRRSGTRIISTATTVEEARWLEARGVDAIIAQGLEAGGHRGMFLSSDLTHQVGTLALVRQVVHAVRVPVIAAGGIADSARVRAVLALGASAAQVGTAFLLCPEATTSPVHRAALQGEGARHTALTNLFTGRPARGIVNRFVRELGPLSPLTPPFPLAAAAVAPLRARAESLGSGDFSPLWAGQHASGCRARPAADLLRSLVAT